MKKIISIIVLLTAAYGLSWAGQVYTKGNQFPATCGPTGLFLQANGNCTTSWIAAPPPTSLLSTQNSWLAQQDFGVATFGSNSLKVDASGFFVSPGNDFRVFASNGSTAMMRNSQVSSCYAGHTACTSLEIGSLSSQDVVMTSYAGSTFSRLAIAANGLLLGAYTYNRSPVPTAIVDVRNDDNQYGPNAHVVTFAVTPTSDQDVDNFQLRDSSATAIMGETINGGWYFTSKTISEIGAITPGHEGETYYCSNCTVTALCTSKSLTTGDFVSPASKSVPCS